MTKDKSIKSFKLDQAKREENLNAVLDRVPLLCKSIGPNAKYGLHEIASFPGDPKFFDVKKMTDYIKSGTFIPTTSAQQRSISGSKIEEMASNFSAGISVSGSGATPSGAVLSGSMSTEFGSSESSSSETKFSQTRITMKFGSITLPPPIKHDQLRDLASQDTLNLIDGCKNKKSAEEIVKGLGPLYIRSGTFGAVLVMSTFSESTEFKSSDELEAAVSAEASYLTTSVSTEMKFSIGKQKGKKNTNMEVNIVSSGGDPASILKGDLDAWLDSAKKEPVLSSFSLAPISDLAIRGSTAETLLLAEVEKLSRDTLDNFQSLVIPVSNNKNTLDYFERLEEYQELKSPNGKYRLVMQEDGNLVGYQGNVNAPGAHFWSSETSGKGKGPYHLTMQTDGNLVVYGSTGAIWSTETAGKSGHQFVLQDDRNLVLYSYQRKDMWSSKTYL